MDKCPVCVKDAELANHILVACQLGSSPLDGCFVMVLTIVGFFWTFFN